MFGTKADITKARPNTTAETIITNLQPKYLHKAAAKGPFSIKDNSKIIIRNISYH